MKQKFVFFPFLIILMAFCFVFPTNKALQKTSANSSAKPIITPTLLTSIDQELYIYDQDSSGVFSKSLDQGSSQIEPNFALVSDKIIALKANSNNVYALTQNTEQSQSIIKLTKDLSVVNSCTISLNSFAVNEVIDIAVTDTTLTTLKTNGDLTEFEIDGNNLNFIRTISKGDLDSIVANVKINQIDSCEHGLYLSSELSVYHLDTTHHTLEIEEKLSTIYPLKDIYANGSSFVGLHEDGVVSIIQGETTTFNVETSNNLSSVCLIGTNVYFSSPSTHQIFYCSNTNNGLKDLKINSDIEVTYKQLDFLHLTTLSTTSLYLQPYSVNPWLQIEEGSHLTVISSKVEGYTGISLCLYSANGKNYYLYLKDNSTCVAISQKETSQKYVCVYKTSVYSHPTTVQDDISHKVQDLEISPQTEVGLLMASTVSNDNDENFYLIKIGDKQGYVLKSALQPLDPEYSLTIKCNAKTKRQTTIYASTDGTDEIITLNKNTRIQLQEDPSPEKKYLEVKYQAPNGIVYSGYILNDDVDPDGLSLLQIMGLILIVANVAVLIVIVVVKKRSKKWKLDTSNDDDDIPSNPLKL